MGEIAYTGHYARLHQFTDGYYEAMANSYRRFIREYLPANRSVRILDVGCGTGFLLNAVRRAGYASAEGIDADPGQVSIGSDRGIPISHVPAEEVPQFLRGRREAFDAILLVDVLEHVPKAAQIPLLESILVALAPGGRLICQVPNALYPLATYNLYIDWTHHSLFSTESLAFVLENAGFRIARIEAGHDKPSPPRGAVAALVMPVARALLQGIVGTAWRVVTLSGLGPKGISHPISANLIAIAEK